jgi:hypothetical protein
MAGRKKFGRQKRKHYRRYFNFDRQIFFRFSPRLDRKDFVYSPNAEYKIVMTFQMPIKSRMGVIYGE